MSADPFVRDPLPGSTLDGLTIAEAIRLQGETRIHSDDDELRLEIDRRPDKRRGPQAPSRSAIITLWAVGLIAALGIASYTQIMLQRNAAVAMDAPPPPPDAAPDTLTKPIPPDQILSVPAPIAAAAPDAAPGAPSATTTTGEASSAPAETPAPALAKAADAGPAKAEAPAKAAIKAEAADGTPVKAKTEAKAAKVADASPHKAAGAKTPADDIVHLRGQLNHAYALAVKAGVPKAVLKKREAEWKTLYAKAKHKSPEAVAALYKTRAAQLSALARRQHAAGRRTG